ncbi:unnamed protein product [Parnassius apollo]|uniref:(apollo) hypothetical protein n=1 Tax=Parnassius apollo TaxID=110799 RepID=A0A8S3WQ08_PARAO|nr:unnamed protein product [Parnassius apollo]
MVCKLGCIRKGPKPLSPDPETIDILSMIPQKFEMDSNVFDSDRITNITPLHFMMQSEIDRRMKRKLTFNHMNDNTLIHTTKRKERDLTRELNHVLVACVKDIKMKNMTEAHTFIKEERNLKTKKILLEKEEMQLRV